MTIRFDTTIKAERIKVLKRLACLAGLLKDWYQVNTYDETIQTPKGEVYLEMDDRGTYSANCTLCYFATGNEV